MIFASFEVLISKSVAQFFALIFAYIMELRKAVKNKISTISDSSHPHTQQQADGRKSSKDLVNTALSGYLNPLNKSAHPCEPPCHNRVIVSTLGLQGTENSRICKAFSKFFPVLFSVPGICFFVLLCYSRKYDISPFDGHHIFIRRNPPTF